MAVSHSRRLVLDEHPDLGRQRARYRQILATLKQYAHCFRGKRIMDLGASAGLSGLALCEAGAASVVGVEPNIDRVAEGCRWIAALGVSNFTLLHVPDTRQIPLPDATFDAILANAVLEHIPQPRDAYIRECWRVLKPGGVLFVSETPNKYLPWDVHTLNFPLTNWLPSKAAQWVARKTGRIRRVNDPWEYSGWRGLGYYELVNAIPGAYRTEHEMTRARHAALRMLRLPSALLDPYPVYRIWKV